MQHAPLSRPLIQITLSRYRSFLTPLQQTTFENIVAKGEIDHKEQFVHFITTFSILFKNYIDTKVLPTVDLLYV